MSAFVAPTGLSACPTSSLRGQSLSSRAAPRAAPVSRRHATVRAVMAEGSGSGSSAPSIDFGKVNIDEFGSNLAGLVFTPETNVESALKTRVDVGYNPAQEAAVNDHINVEYTAMYAYHALWAFFDRDAVALPGFAKYFREQSDEERDHAHEFMQYQNRRGGTVHLKPIALPEMKFAMSSSGVSDALYAMELALQLEKFVYKKLMDVHKVADECSDPQMCDFVEEYLSHQLESIKEIAEYVAQIKRVGTPHGVYHIDLSLRGDAAA